jgi:hypothetical protein
MMGDFGSRNHDLIISCRQNKLSSQVRVERTVELRNLFSQIPTVAALAQMELDFLPFLRYEITIASEEFEHMFIEVLHGILWVVSLHQSLVDHPCNRSRQQKLL